MAIDINNATVEELEQLEGVSTELAMEIVDYRDEMGGFTSLDDLLDVEGIDEVMLMKLRDAGANLGAAAEAEGSSDF